MMQSTVRFPLKCLLPGSPEYIPRSATGDTTGTSAKDERKSVHIYVIITVDVVKIMYFKS